MTVKKQLAATLVDMYHPDGAGKAAREEFERVFSQKQLPDEIPEIDRDQLQAAGFDPQAVYLVKLMTHMKLSKSNGEARKLITGGGVSLNGERVSDTDFEFAANGEMVLKVGKRRFLRIKG